MARKSQQRLGGSGPSPSRNGLANVLPTAPTNETMIMMSADARDAPLSARRYMTARTTTQLTKATASVSSSTHRLIYLETSTPASEVATGGDTDRVGWMTPSDFRTGISSVGTCFWSGCMILSAFLTGLEAVRGGPWQLWVAFGAASSSLAVKARRLGVTLTATQMIVRSWVRTRTVPLEFVRGVCIVRYTGMLAGRESGFKMMRIELESGESIYVESMFGHPETICRIVREIEGILPQVNR